MDSTTGLYYLRARYMNPTTGTFISMDTYQGSIFDPTSLHKYLYANANPVMYCDPSGYSTASIQEMGYAMACFSVLDAAQAVYDATCVAIGLMIIHKLTECIIEYQSQITELVFNVVEGIDSAINWTIASWWARVKEKIRSEAIDIATTGDRRDGDQVYYHATTSANALIIMATRTLIGSEMEGRYVFAWKRLPNKKALKKSGAKNAEVIVVFSTFASFEPDWGIDDSYVKMFEPVCTVFPGPVIATKVGIIPII